MMIMMMMNIDSVTSLSSYIQRSCRDYLLAGGVTAAVDRANADEALVVAERQVATLSIEDELQSVERPVGVRAVAGTQRKSARRYIHNCTPTDGMVWYGNNNNDRLTAFDPGQPG